MQRNAPTDGVRARVWVLALLAVGWALMVPLFVRNARVEITPTSPATANRTTSPGGRPAAHNTETNSSGFSPMLTESNAITAHRSAEQRDQVVLKRALLLHLSDPEAHVRRDAIAQLKEFRTQPEFTIPLLISCLTDSDAEVRALAAEQISYYRTRAADAVPTLKHLATEDPDEKVRDRVKDALYNIRGYDAIFNRLLDR